PSENRKLAAIMFTDMVGYSALMHRDEKLALTLLAEHHRLLRPLFPEFGGREIKSTGDGFLVEYASALQATQCALEIQRVLIQYNATMSAERRIHIRIGIHLGDVVLREADIFGDDVNIAARIEPLAEGGGICLSGPVYDQVVNKLDTPLVKLDAAQLKNIKTPIDVYRVVLPWQQSSLLGQASSPRTAHTREGRVVLLGWAAIILLIGALAVFRPQPELPKIPSTPPKSVVETHAIPALDPLRIALLPFKNFSPALEDEHFARAIADQLGIELSKISGLAIIPRINTQIAALEPRLIGEKTESGTLLTGTVRKVDNRITVNIRLIDSSDGVNHWGETFAGEMKDLDNIQNKVAFEVARILKVKLLEAERQQIEKKYTNSSKAFELYLKGRDGWNSFTSEGLRQGIIYLKQAIAEDPNYALAYSGLADCNAALASDFEPPKPVLAEAERYARRALRIDPELAQAEVSLAMYYMFSGSNWEKAREHAIRAIQLKPRYADAHHYMAHYLESQGKLAEAKNEWFLALQYDPLSSVIAIEFALTYLFIGDYPSAIALCREALAMEVDFVYGLQILGAALTFKGDYQVATETLQGALTLKEGDRPIIIAELGHTYAKAGKMAEAGEQLRRLLKLQDQGRFVDAYYLAWVYAGLGEMVEAQRSLEKAVREQSTWIFNINVNPRLIPLHNETTFHDLLKRMNLE
ncbi:MAG TPA: hypothetical protein EYG38_19955, partial [Verrucomicrobia bacterium]|nr:hypothetical protein [Verrucomicrobiota bacterium]